MGVQGSFQISVRPISNSEILILEILSTKSWSLVLSGIDVEVGGTEMVGFGI